MKACQAADVSAHTKPAKLQMCQHNVAFFNGYNNLKSPQASSSRLQPSLLLFQRQGGCGSQRGQEEGHGLGRPHVHRQEPREEKLGLRGRGDQHQDLHAGDPRGGAGQRCCK